MRSKCSFILKATTALVLALLMLFGTVATSLAAVVDDFADTGAEAEIADEGFEAEITETGANFVVGSKIYYEVSNAVSWWSNSPADTTMSVKFGNGSWLAMTKERDKLFSIDVPAGTSTNSITFGRGSTSQHYNDFSNASYGGGDNNTFWQSGENGGGWGLCPTTVKNKTYIYVDNSNEFLNKDQKFFVIGHDDGDGYYRKITLNQISGTNLYYCTESNDWSDSRYVGLFSSASGWSAGDASKKWSDITTCADGYKTRYSGAYEFSAGNSTLLTTSSAADEATLTPTYLGTSTDENRYGALNYTQTFNVQLTTDGGATGSNQTLGATITASGKKLDGLSSTTNSSFSVSSSANTNNDKAARTSTVSLSTADTSQYEFVGWYNGNTRVSTNTSYSYTVTGANTINARFKQKPQLTIAQTDGTNTVTGTVTIGGNTATSAYLSTATDTAISITAPTGYTISSVTGTGWTRTAGETSTTTYTGKANISADQTFTVTYAEILDSAVALTAYTNGEASTTGGTIQVGDADVTSIPAGNIGVTTSVTAVSAVSGADYIFTGWQFDGSNYNKLKYKFTAGDAWQTPAAQNTTYGTSSDTTIYLKTDGSSGLTTADAIVKAMFVTGKRTVTTAALLATDGTGYSSTLGSLSPSLTGSGSYAAAGSPATVTLTATDDQPGYKFVGWFASDTADLTSADLSSAVQGTSGIYTYTPAECELSFTMDTTCKLNYYALYKKIYYITAYDSYTYDIINGEKDNFVFRTSPPRTITATNAQGTTTFTYESGTITQRGEDNYGNGNGSDPNANTGATPNIKTSGTFYEGNLLQVLAGDSIVMTYSTLSSSDVIRGVFFNNDIRYTTELEYDNLYKNRIYQGYHQVLDDNGDPKEGEYDGNGADDKWCYTYEKATTLFADASYYQAEKVEGTNPAVLVKDRINSVTSNGTSPYYATVNQEAHTVTFVANQDYKNIDIELGAKRKLVFSDTKNTKITEVETDHYYAVGDQISTGSSVTAPVTRLAVYAKSNGKQETKITGANIKFYYYNATEGYFTDASGNEVADADKVELPAGTFTVTRDSGSTAYINATSSGNSANYYYFTGAMPNTDVYVDLDVYIEYTMYIGSAVVADATNTADRMADVGTVSAIYTTPESSTRTAPADAAYNTTADKCAQGEKVKYTFTWNTGWDTYYMFLGWYKGTASGPDYSSKPLSKNLTMNDYVPTENTYIYAVGTRDVFINGSKYITGASQNWNAGNSNKNFRMEFDPTYTSGGNRGRYYWEVTDAMLTSASNVYFQNVDWSNNGYVAYDDWDAMDASTNPLCNSYFQFFDVESGDENQSLWRAIDPVYKNNQVSTYGVKYGKICPTSDNHDNTWEKKNGFGFIQYSASDATYAGWSTTFTISYYPASNTFDVQATYIHPHIYVSNGYKNIDQATPSNVSISVDGTASGNNGSSSNSTQGKAYYNDSGWTSLSNEGTVRDITVKAKNATVRVTKTVASSDYKVSYFFVYNLATKEKKAVAATATSGTANSYYADVKMNNDEKMYICPIVERTSADMTVIFDATQMNYTQWGQFVSCYAWYSSGEAYGAYPGQLMVPYDGGKTWKCTFPSTNPGDSTKKLVGITFANYVDGSSTWLGGAVGSSGGTVMSEILGGYNSVGDGDYHKENCKAQTYDYREPIAYYTNSIAGGSENVVLTFAFKRGNSNLITWTYGDMTGSNIKTHIEGGSNYASYPVAFEYLVDQKGNYVDFNGNKVDGTPSASFYVCAKGMATYQNNTMVRQFWSANYYETLNGSVPSGKSGWTSAITYDDAYGATSGVSLDYAVEWYVYDASGKFITTVLSSGYADKSNDDITNNGKTVNGARTQIAKRLDDLGYATVGRSVMISYDQPRYCYNTPEAGQTNAGIANGGTSFDAYRFAGQWVQQNQYETAKVYVKVGLSTASGYELANSSSAAYGSAEVNLNKGLLDLKTYAGTETKNGVETAWVTIIEGDKGAITLSAESTNFKGWYYDENAGTEEPMNLVLASTEPNYEPGLGKDITYYAIYEPKAVYKYNYTGREGSKSFSKSGGLLTPAEIDNNNTVATDRSDFSTSAPGADSISIFKKTINFATLTNANNSTAYVLSKDLTGVTDATFTLTYYYPNGSNGTNVQPHTAGTADIAYNTVANLPDENSAAISANAPDGQRFVGWYEYNARTQEVGELLSIYPNYGMRIVKDTSIYAQYAAVAYAPGEVTAWRVSVEDHAITKEKTSATNGTYYNDTIIRVTGNNDVNATIPEGAEAGILLVKSGDDTTIDTAYRTVTQLKKYVNNLSNGKTARITTAGATVTKLSATGGSSSSLTMYNRADFGIRSDYSVTNGQAYSVYAYLKLSDGTFYFSGETYGDGTVDSDTSGVYN